MSGHISSLLKPSSGSHLSQSQSIVFLMPWGIPGSGLSPQLWLYFPGSLLTCLNHISLLADHGYNTFHLWVFPGAHPLTWTVSLPPPPPPHQLLPTPPQRAVCVPPTVSPAFCSDREASPINHIPIPYHSIPPQSPSSFIFSKTPVTTWHSTYSYSSFLTQDCEQQGKLYYLSFRLSQCWTQWLLQQAFSAQ